MLYSDEPIHIRKDNIIYFLDEKGKPLEKRAQELIKYGRIEKYSDYELNTYNIRRARSAKYYDII